MPLENDLLKFLCYAFRQFLDLPLCTVWVNVVGKLGLLFTYVCGRNSRLSTRKKQVVFLWNAELIDRFIFASDSKVHRSSVGVHLFHTWLCKDFLSLRASTACSTVTHLACLQRKRRWPRRWLRRYSPWRQPALQTMETLDGTVWESQTQLFAAPIVCRLCAVSLLCLHE